MRIFTGHSGQTRCVAYSPDSRLAVSGDNTGLVFLWDVAGRWGARQLDGHSDGANAVAFSADGVYLATGGSDGKVRVWDVADE
jgi:WD40 repeat protein